MENLGKENVIPTYEGRDSTVILFSTLVELFSYSTFGLRMEYGNNSPRVEESMTVLSFPSEIGMYHTFPHEE